MDNRLRAIMGQITPCKLLIDVGTDHGKIPAEVARLGLADAVIATDISPNSLKKAELLAKKRGYDNIRFVVTDGINGIEERADIIVIAGMGGREIVKILKTLAYFPTLILVPHRNAEAVRAHLSGRAQIVTDTIVADAGKYYPLIVAREGSWHYDDCDLQFGINLPHSPHFGDMIAQKKQRLLQNTGDSLQIEAKIKEMDDAHNRRG